MAQLQSTTVNGETISLRIDNITTVSRLLTLDDRNKSVLCNNTSTITITVPNDTTTLFPIGAIVYINRNSTGIVTLAAAAGVSVSRSGNLGAKEELYIRKRAANTWFVINQPRQSGVN